MTGGALFAPPGASSIAGSALPTPRAAVKGRPEAERGHKGLHPGAGVPAISGEPYSAVTFDGWSRCDTEREETQRSPLTVSPYPSITPSAERRRCVHSPEAAELPPRPCHRQAEAK